MILGPMVIDLLMREQQRALEEAIRQQQALEQAGGALKLRWLVPRWRWRNDTPTRGMNKEAGAC